MRGESLRSCASCAGGLRSVLFPSLPLEEGLRRGRTFPFKGSFFDEGDIIIAIGCPFKQSLYTYSPLDASTNRISIEFSQIYINHIDIPFRFFYNAVSKETRVPPLATPVDFLLLVACLRKNKNNSRSYIKQLTVFSKIYKTLEFPHRSMQERSFINTCIEI